MFNPTHEEIVELVRAAVQAPSADNRHHIHFRIDPAGLELWSDDRAAATGELHQRMLHLLSVGAVVENLRLASTRKGWTFTPRWLPYPSSPRCLLDLRWGAFEAAVCDPLAERLFTRHTNRRFFTGPAATDGERRMLEDSVASVPGIRLHWMDEGRQRRALIRLMRHAESARFRIDRLHSELFESINFEAGWANAVDERLAPATLGVEPFLRAPFAALRHRRVMRIVNALGGHHLLGLRAAAIPAALAPHRVVFSSEATDDASLLEGGIAFERFWLAADQLGLEVQPMVAAAVLTTLDGSDLRERRLATKLREGWNDLIGNRRALIVARLGHAAHPDAVSSRQSAARYLTTVIERTPAR